MRNIILLTLMVGISACTSPSPELRPPVPRPELRPPPTTVKTCADQISLLDEDSLARGASCPDNTKLIFPSYYRQGKVLVLCQCK